MSHTLNVSGPREALCSKHVRLHCNLCFYTITVRGAQIGSLFLQYRPSFTRENKMQILVILTENFASLLKDLAGAKQNLVIVPD